MRSKAVNPTAPSRSFEKEFLELAQFRRETPLGRMIVDRELRYVLVDEHMAASNGKPADQHFGKTIQEVAPESAPALVPIFQHVIEEGMPLVDVEVEVSRPSASDASHLCYWLVSFYPLKTEEGEVRGAAATVQDITDKKLKELEQEERLKFEALLTSLSATFINVSVSEVDTKIEQELQKIVEFLGFDRSSVFLFSPDGQKLFCTHTYALPGIKPPPPDIETRLPVWTNMVRQGEMFQVADFDEMPDNQWREKKYCKEQGGIKSILYIPLKVGGTVLGLISFVSYRVKRNCPDVLIKRLRLLSEVFGNALERKRADQEIQKAFAEIEQLKNRLEAENLYLRDQIDIEQKHEEIIGKSEAIRKVLLQVEQVANTDSTVLILGETGTGKELLARAIHNLSGRKNRPMIRLNCAALPATLIEAELFGREKGAYTGASTTQAGRFEAAHGSTIFLDEIGELPLELQAKLLRVLQEGQFERLGSTRPIDVDARVIAATNRNLARAVREGRFREDLYYRLNVFPISVPPLRERREDIPLLAWAMVKEFGHIFGKSIERIPRKNMEALERYPWPGNVRELRNMIERAMILSNSPTLLVELPDTSPATASQATTLEEMERMHILSVLEKTGWRVRGPNGAAAILGLKPTTLDSKMKKLGIRRKIFSS